MQHIDENTYIDETLVTYAEYQLFIDEMREQGQYYQPDHWISHQFTEKKGMEPVLGVRITDAKEFCSWLTNRAFNSWKFRLPTHREADSHLLTSFNKIPIGYWTEEGFQYIFNNAISVNVRCLSASQVVMQSLDYFSEFDIYYEDNELKQIINSAILNRQSRPLRLDRNLHSEFYSLLNNNQSIELVLKFFDSINFVLDRSIYPSDITENNFGFKLSPALRLAFNNIISSSTFEAINFFSQLFIDIFTLQERIAGRSPAFEGIRLVKERIR